MVTLSCLLKRVVKGGLLSGCKMNGISARGVLIFHLLFVDDTLGFYLTS